MLDFSRLSGAVRVWRRDRKGPKCWVVLACGTALARPFGALCSRSPSWVAGTEVLGLWCSHLLRPAAKWGRCWWPCPGIATWGPLQWRRLCSFGWLVPHRDALAALAEHVNSHMWQVRHHIRVCFWRLASCWMLEGLPACYRSNKSTYARYGGSLWAHFSDFS